MYTGSKTSSIPAFGNAPTIFRRTVKYARERRAMSGISDAVDLTGRLAKLAKTTMTLETQEQIVELPAAMLDAQGEILALRA